MRRALLLASGFVWMSSNAIAGTVTLDPPIATVSQGEVAEFIVTISATDMAEFDAIDVLISSDQTLNLEFTYDITFNPSFPATTPVPFGLFSSDLLLGGFKIERWQAPVLLGTLRVDTTTLPPGTYAQIIGARPQREQDVALTALSKVTLGLASEVLSGTADIVVLDPGASTGGGAGGGPSTGDGTATTLDTDGDGVGNNADLDDDGDGIPDVDDPTPLGDVGSSGNTGGDSATGDTGGSDNTAGGQDTTGGDATPVPIPTCGAGMASIMLATFFGLFAVRARRRYNRFHPHESSR